MKGAAQGGDTLTKISPFEAKWVEQKSTQTLQPGDRKIMQIRIKLTKS